MKRKTFYQFLFAGAIICALLVIPFGLELWSQDDSNDGGIRLAAPSFLKQAHAQEDVSAAGIETVLGDAGFSAYFRKDGGINLDNVEGLYRTVEDRTDTYIIGSIDIGDYGEEEAPHVFITTDGWVMAYYPAFYSDGTEIPLSRSIDIVNYDGIEFNTKLKSALNKVTPAIGLPASTVPTYYHFIYPNATHLTIIGEIAGATATFEAKIPGSFNYMAIGWTYVRTASCCSGFSVNGVSLASSGYRYANLNEERIYNASIKNGKIGIVLLYSKE